MRKLLITLLTILIIVVLIVFILTDRFNTEKILGTIEEKTGLNIQLLDEGVWKFYPSITYSNSNVKIMNKDSSFTVENSNILINKSYWPTSPVWMDIIASTVNYKGMEMRNAVLQAKYAKNIIHIEKLTGNIIEGLLNLNGKIDLEDKQTFTFQGQFKNISLNTLLKQSQLATWNRVNIKLSSPSFKVSGKKNKDQNWVTSLIGTFPIKGSLYFTSTDEERFGAALLSLLVEKIPSLTSVSRSVDFLLSTYANVPSSLNGILTLKNGWITSEEIFITNEEGKSTLKGSYNFLENTINGTIYFYEQDEIFLEASLLGAIENPQILVAGKVFSDKKEQPMQDIKQLLEKGLNSFIEKMLSTNE